MTMPITAELMLFKKIQRFIGLQDDSTWILLDCFLFWSLGFIMLALAQICPSKRIPTCLSDGRRTICSCCVETWAWEERTKLGV